MRIIDFINKLYVGACTVIFFLITILELMGASGSFVWIQTIGLILLYLLLPFGIWQVIIAVVLYAKYRSKAWLVYFALVALYAVFSYFMLNQYIERIGITGQIVLIGIPTICAFMHAALVHHRVKVFNSTP